MTQWDRERQVQVAASELGEQQELATAGKSPRRREPADYKPRRATCAARSARPSTSTFS